MDLDPLKLVAQGAVSAGGVDQFPSTDPQYVSASRVGSAIDIEFRLELMSKTEAEELVVALAADRDRYATEFQVTYQHLMGTANELREAEQRLAESETRLREIENSLSWRMTGPLRTFAARTRRRRFGPWGRR
ncbi:hypothetical protein [Microbacterium sp.]|uniref:hypothetical protein n=1 Tax=Microbacterium sp. TaxID=51671 RepID=UPI003C78873B